MEVLGEKCTLALVISALLVLAVNGGYIDVESLSLSAGALSISGVKAANHLLLPIGAFAVLTA